MSLMEIKGLIYQREAFQLNRSGDIQQYLGLRVASILRIIKLISGMGMKNQNKQIQ
ncbi:unnamed protein product [Paramecium octaurelia]|uniref:Uncharacterized protein n=1 Tax=Paramecium octaurelia TaxID=43137 RepID=A0A8S1V7Q8_PAROT|nr:unnamed protein product [Paramecium octaurelia]